ncbi:uncharacterized protein A4U43_C04F21920 [Asparagus officinalis]|uniref:Uncharacterized protein n=1 Tax=Asparagus officinalis TaxID=4686 RepID=A0A5P1F2T0_ASPOF|nr:uncharacterized protein A4U43_C04F21920 [Asparagus officinalis]
MTKISRHLATSKRRKTRIASSRAIKAMISRRPSSKDALGSARNITFSNIQVTKVEKQIAIDQFYNAEPSESKNEKSDGVWGNASSDDASDGLPVE